MAKHSHTGSQGKSMQEPTFLILTALAGGGTLHGYAIILQVRELSDGRVNLRAGTLYAALERLSEAGLIEIAAEGIVDNRLRRYYMLTSEGAAQLSAEAERLSAQAKLARSRLRALLESGSA